MTIADVLGSEDQRRDDARRMTASAVATDGVLMSTARFHEWLAARAAANSFRVERIPFARMKGWLFAPGTGNLVHHTGRFFSVDGLEVSTDFGWTPKWSQPITNQPEIGIVGIVAREFDGVLHFLMQAKMEPGNVNTIQLSPTVQATRSNYTRVHNGSPIPYLEYFVAPRHGRVLVDALQSEQGAWFLHKRNRNMIVEVTEDLPVHEDFCWLTLGQLHELMATENLVNMDTRTVLSGLRFAGPAGTVRDTGGDRAFREALALSVGGAGRSLLDLTEVLSWLVEAKARHLLVQRTVPLRELPDWECRPDEIAHRDGKYFRVVGVSVHASNREVSDWTQPLVAPVGHGLSAFLARQVDGVLHVLVRARVEAGTFDVLEISPTVHCLPSNYADLPAERRPPFLDYVLSAPRERVRYDVLQSEEGGRFYHAQNRYVVIEVGADFPLRVPEDYQWLTVAQLTTLLQLSNHVNVEARSLVACLQTLW